MRASPLRSSAVTQCCCVTAGKRNDCPHRTAKLNLTATGTIARRQNVISSQMNFYDLQALRPYSSRSIEAPLRHARQHVTQYTWQCLRSLSHMRFHRVVPMNQKLRARHSFHRQRASRGSFERYLVRPLCVRNTNIAARCVEYERAARHVDVDDVTDSTGPAGYRVSTYPRSKIPITMPRARSADDAVSRENPNFRLCHARSSFLFTNATILVS